MTLKPLGLVTLRSPAGAASRIPESCLKHAVETARFQWFQGDPGNPAELLEAFLNRYGAQSGHPVCGAAVLISAAGGAAMIGGQQGTPSPAPDVPDVAAVVYGAGDPGPIPTAGKWHLGPWRPSWTPAQHASAVEQVRAAIARGDVYQVNVVGHASAEYEGDPYGALQRVAAIQGARYAGIMGGDGWAVACASPETLLEVRGDRLVTRPIKGTAPATELGRRELLSSPKERAEHVMIVDLERNDLSHVAVTGSVRVTELFKVQKWAGLWQAESEVEARLKPGTTLAEVLQAVCPGGSVTGAPKLAALTEIAKLEPVGRGPAMGALGWVGQDYIDLGLTIRTVAVDAHRVHLWAGGGITIDSDPWAEVAEADAKAAPIKAALAAT